MRIFNKYRGTRGFVVAAERGIRFRYMITKEAIRRTEIIAFWSKHGLLATLDAFKVKRRTLFNWKHKLKQGGGRLDALNPKSRAPKTRRCRIWAEQILAEIRVIFATNTPISVRTRFIRCFKNFVFRLA